MDLKENKKALHASIKKYRKIVKLLEDNAGKKVKITEPMEDVIVENKEIAYGHISCPLCKLYRKHPFGKDSYKSCTECCIANDTGDKFCDNTPYNKYENTLLKSKSVTKKLITSAKEELAYLEELFKKLKDGTFNVMVEKK